MTKETSKKVIRSDRRLNYGFALAIFGLIGIGFFLRSNVKNIKTITDQRAKARQTAYKIHSLVTSLTAAETGQRGYLLTGKPQYLAPYRVAVVKIPQQFQELEYLLIDSPSQLRLLKSAQYVTRIKLAELNQTIQLRKTKGFAIALKVVLTDHGQQTMDQLRSLADQLESEEQYQIAQRNKEMDAILSRTSNVVLIGSSLAALLVGAFLYLLARNQERRFVAETELRRTNTALELQKASLSKVIFTQNEIATAPMNSAAIMDMAVDYSMDLTQADGGVIEIVEGNELVYHHTSGAAKQFIGMRIKMDNSFSGLCLSENKHLICEDSEIDPRVDLAACRKVNVRSMIVLPLYHGTDVVGVLKNYSSKPGHFTEQNCDSLRLVTGILASALGQASAFEEKNNALSALRKIKVELEAAKDAAEAATKTKSQFLANMSHELRTPLNGILGLTNLLLDTPINPQQKDFLSTILSSGESLLHLLNDVLDFSKIEAGKYLFEELDFDLVSTLQDVRKSFQYQADKKHLSLEMQIDPKVPHYVKGDPGRLRQVLMNLIGNALKFTSQGFVKIRARVLDQDESMVRLEFEVEDSGIGIPQEVTGNLFQEFTQADSSTTRRYGGTGLGLSISKKIVQRMNGEIGVHSHSGGSTFWFQVELKQGHIVEMRPSASAAPVVNFEGKAWRILVVEDNQVNQMVALQMLEKMGLRADAVAHGKEAIDALEKRPYDIVLMDCQMPEMDGYEATRLIRASKIISNPDLPIIAMTANALIDDNGRSLQAGMNDHISKPVSIVKLGEVLKKWTQFLEERQRQSA